MAQITRGPRDLRSPGLSTEHKISKSDGNYSIIQPSKSVTRSDRLSLNLNPESHPCALLSGFLPQKNILTFFWVGQRMSYPPR